MRDQMNIADIIVYARQLMFSRARMPRLCLRGGAMP